MTDTDASEPTLEQLIDNELGGEDVKAAARRAFLFLSACADGEVPEAKISDRIMAARSVLEHAAHLPDLLGELAEAAGLADDDDVAIVVAALT